MSGWIESDATGVTLRLPPLPDPALLVLLAAAVLFLLAMLTTKRLARLGWRTKAFLAGHYVALVFAGVALVCLWAAWIGLLRVPMLAGGLLAELRESTRDGSDPERTRRIVFALAAILAAITIFGTLVAQSIRVWINERTARTAEANLVTGLINTAVEGLGAEKSVSRIGRSVRLTPPKPTDHMNADTQTLIEWEGEALTRDNATNREPGEWKTFDTTRPNLEVRIGAILTLERISREYPGEHIRVMDILCAYIRENAPAHGGPQHGLGEWPRDSRKPDAVSLGARERQLLERGFALSSWITSLPPPRTDVQLALEVIGRRPDARKEREEAAETRNGMRGYRLDLRRTNLRHCTLSHLDFSGALLVGARMEGAHLREARLMEADLREARLEATDLFKARLERANLSGAWLESASLSLAQLNEANLSAAKLEGAGLGWAQLDRTGLREARLEGADLSGARLDGADLRGAGLKNSKWAGASIRASLAHSADLRGARQLTQALLDQMIGDDGTLLPEGLSETGERFHVWTCWQTPPSNLDHIVTMAAYPFPSRFERDAVHASFVCGPDHPRRPTGTPLAVDAPYPDGHRPFPWRR